MRLILLLSLLLPSSLFAAEYNQLIKQNSQINFSYQQMGVSMTGHFADFSAKIYYDPEQLDKTQASFSIPLSSIRTGVEEADAELPNKLWFDSAHFPNATLQLNKLQLNNQGVLSAEAILSIKGHSQKINIALKQVQQGKNIRLSGQLPIKRLDFAIGDGMWRDVSVVANQVTISFNLLLSTL